MVSVGDEIVVKCLGVDKKGRLNFSRKEALPKKKKVEKKETEEVVEQPTEDTPVEE